MSNYLYYNTPVEVEDFVNKMDKIFCPFCYSSNIWHSQTLFCLSVLNFECKECGNIGSVEIKTGMETIKDINWENIRIGV